jgi:hypothetical protein
MYEVQSSVLMHVYIVRWLNQDNSHMYHLKYDFVVSTFENALSQQIYYLIYY